MLRTKENSPTSSENVKKTFNISEVIEDETIKLRNRTSELEKAIQTVLRYIGSHQVYDKDARGILLRALNKQPF